ncbi:serine/threonine-protein kinase [Gemmatimonas sp.]|uniref:serine/threonine-protein kinase n=1 Tax=Gemmatimonas sp. TaxID=1962908 RepID=UPI00333F4549
MTLGDRPALPTRFRFASGDGDRTSGRDELAVTLQARLHVVTIVLLAIGLLLSIIAFWRIPEVTGSTRTVLKAVQVVMGGIFPPVALLAWWLRPRTPRSIAALRLVESGVFVSFNLLFASLMIADFPSIVPIIETAPFDLGFGAAIIPCFFIVSYGLLIPNRWQRAAVMIGLILALVVVTNLWNFSHYAVATNVMATFLGSQWTFLLAFTTMALFGANRIDRAAAVARDALRLGQYVLVERLGAGGMGEVHRAEHRLLRRPCAIKLIRPEHAGNADVLRRFEREVQTTATLTHPNTIAIFDYGITDDGTFYYVMEYLPGDTLEQLVSRDGPMDAQRATHVLIQIAGALHEAHNAGLTHRDIKPGNVMLGERGGVADVAKLLDFGLVTAQNATGEDGGDVTGSITQVGMVLGTPAYMSPEQCAGDEQPGAASDLYSLGALGYFLVTGQSPFEGRAPLQMMLAHMNDAPPSARALRPELPADFDAILQQCLAKRPEDRFASARALEQALRSV